MRAGKVLTTEGVHLAFVECGVATTVCGQEFRLGGGALWLPTHGTPRLADGAKWVVGCEECLRRLGGLVEAVAEVGEQLSALVKRVAMSPAFKAALFEAARLAGLQQPAVTPGETDLSRG